LEEATRQRRLEEENVRAGEAEVAHAEEAQKEKRQLGEAQLGQARADLAEADIRLQHCTVRAPADGTVLSKNVEVGSFVNPLAFGPAAHICEMADLSDLEIEVDIQERDIAR